MKKHFAWHHRYIRLFLYLFFSVLLILANVSAASAAISFGQSTLQGAFPSRPTSLQFGLDGRLYVSEQGGTIKIYSIVRNGANDYQVTDTETLSLIKDMVNHNDDGSLSSVTGRQVTGILVTGTGTHPVLYVGSSDPRIGAGGSGTDTNLDTNSGIISKLTYNGSSWDKVDLVRGLPRSEENHSVNGLEIDEDLQLLYAAQGGNTNAGAPSNNFAKITEFALAAAILSIDLAAIESLPTQYDPLTDSYYKYDLPTLDDPDRGVDGEADYNDPFGGNDGLNQAKIVLGGPVQVYSPGYRNAYDLVITQTPGQAGRMYVVDNGPNGGWGGYPVSEGPEGICTNDYDPNEPGYVNNKDNLHYVPGPGYYAGHPAPIRANPDGAGLYWFDNDLGQGFFSLSPTADWPPVPPELADPIQCDYLQPGVDDGALLTYQTSTNGLTEYSAGNFNGDMQGNLLTASFDGNVYRMVLNGDGNQVTNGLEALFSSFGNIPLDITAQGDSDIFPGTIWVGVYQDNAIAVFEPADYEDAGPISCTGDYDLTLDEDGDGYSNADEIDNNTNPCSSASKPTDRDGDLISDLNDGDDDNDGLSDSLDYFQIDPENGRTTLLPIDYPLYNTYPGTGFYGVGLTGLMANGQDYGDLLLGDTVVAGGASGLFTIEQVSEGDPTGTQNSLKNGFHFGIQVDAATGPFVIQSRLLGPFFGGVTPVDGQTQGIYLGTGSQSDYLKIVLTANGGSGGIQVLFESEDAIQSDSSYAPAGLLSTNYIDFFFAVDPAVGVVQPRYAVNGGAPVDLGNPVPLSGPALNALQNTPALAVGLMATANPPAPSFAATWDFVAVSEVVMTSEGWITILPNGGINSSTYTSGSFQLENTSLEGQQITQVRIDLSSGVFPDMVFDPDGLAGDIVAKDFTVNNDTGTGYMSYTLSGFHNGVDAANGYDVLEIHFNDFDPGEVFTFSIDVDPTSIQGSSAPGPGESGSVSGLEVTGARVSMTFTDGSTHTVQTFRTPASLGGSENTVRSGGPPKPIVEIIGVTADKSTVTDPSQAVRINAPGASHVRLLVVEGALFTEGLTDGGYDIDPYEANSALTVTEIAADINDDGFIEIPITLTRSDPSGGLNHIVAAIEGADGMTGPISDVIVLALEEPSSSGDSLYYINSGGSAVTAGGITWGADQFFSGTSSTYTKAISIAGTTDDVLYQSERYGINFSYSIPVETGTYTVNLYFAEIFYNSAGSRVFSVDVENGQGLLTDLDIAGEAGANAALMKNLTGISVDDGSLDIQFTASVDNAKVSAIEVITETSGSAGALSVSATSLSFGSQPVGSVATRTLTLSNTGDFDVTVADMVLSGDVDDFFVGGVTPFSLSSGESASVNVDFQPATEGDKSAVLTITHDGDNSPLIVNLTGTGASAVTGDVLYRVNAGGSMLTAGDGSGVDWSADSVSNPSAYVNSDVSGNKTYSTAAAITLDPGVPVSVPAGLFQTGRWDPSTPSPEMIWNFPVTDGDYEVRLYFAEIYSGTSGGGLRVFDVFIEGALVLENFDQYTEAGGANTGIMRSFIVTVSDGQLEIELIHGVENTSIKGVEVLNVVQDEAVLTASPSPLNFGSQEINTTTTQDLNLGNTGTIPLTVSGVSISGHVDDFQYDFTTSFVVEPGTTVPFSVAFTPTLAGTRSAELAFTYDGDSSPLLVPLTGEGLEPSTATLSLSTSTLDFGSHPIGSTKVLPLTVSNTGNADLTITDIALSGDTGAFGYTGSTPFTVTPGGSVTMDVEFQPATDGPTSAQMTFTHDGDNSPNAVDLTGTGALSGTGDVLYRINAGGPAVTTGSVDWGGDQFYVGASSTYGNNKSIGGTTDDVLYQSERYGTNFSYSIPVEPGTYTLVLHFAEIYFTSANARIFSVDVENGQGILTDFDIVAEAGANFAVTKAFTGITVDDGNLDIAFTASVNNAKISALEIMSENTDPTAVLSPSPSPLDFGSQTVGTGSTQVLNLSNTGTALLTVTGLSLSGDVDDFGFVDTTPFSIDPGTSVSLSVDFNPTVIGSRSAQLSLENDGDNSPVVVTLSGEGLDPGVAELSASPSLLDFGSQATGTVTSQTLTLSNPGDQDLIITEIVLTGDVDDFDQSGVTPFTVSPGTPVALDIFFQPVTDGNKSAVITVTHDGDNSPVTVDLAGSAVSAQSSEVVYRINAGGPTLTAGDGTGVDWSGDSEANPSVYVNSDTSGNEIYATNSTITLDTSVPVAVPASLFKTERWDPPTPSPEMIWNFPLQNGDYEVRLYFAEIYSGSSGAGLRQFDVVIEGVPVLEDFDQYTEAGGAKIGFIRSVPVSVSDGLLEIELIHIIENPCIKGIEILRKVTNWDF